MASTTAMVDVGSISVVVQSAPATTHTLAPPFSPSHFAASPENHNLPRTGLKDASDKTRFLLAAMDALVCRLQKLSLSEQPAGQPTVPTRDDSVYIDTAAPVTVKGSVRRKLFNYNTKFIAKCTQGIKASFKKAAGKRSDKTKKARGASRPLSQCSSDADPLVGQIVQSMGGRSVLEALEASQHHQVTRFHEMFSFEVREPTAQGYDFPPPPTYFGVPFSNALPAVATIGDGAAYVPMDEDVHQAPSPLPTSPVPVPMELEGGIPSNNVTSVGESPQTQFYPLMDRELDASVAEPSDTLMSDGEDASREEELIRQGESTKKTSINSDFTERVSSTPVDQEVDMKDANDSSSFTSIQQASIRLIRPIGATSTSNGLDGISETDTSQSPVRTPAPAASAGIAPLEGAPARSLLLDTTPEAQQPTEIAQDEETKTTQRQVAPIRSWGLVSTSPNVATSINLQPVATPSPTATSSTAGPSTPNLSARRSLTPDEVQPPKTHAARLHQALGKWGLSKRASKSPQLPVWDEVSEEAELNAFLRLAQHQAPRPSVKSQSRLAPPRDSSEQKQTKGSAARSLMDDIMAGFRGVPKEKSSQHQVAAAVQPPAQSRTTLRTSSAIPPRDQRPTSVVAGRQPGPQSTPPRHVGTGCGVVASRGSVIPSRAPPSISTTGQANGPPAGNPVQVGVPSEAAPPGTTLESGAAMDGVEPGRMVKGSRRVARAIAKTGWTWEAAQQKAREAQTALELENTVEEVLAPASSLTAFEEKRKSSAWHAAQPPPPPEANLYINVGRKFRRGT